MGKRGLCCRVVSVRVRLSVRQSDMLVYCINTAEEIVKLFLGPVASSITLVFLTLSADIQFQGELCTGWEIFAILK